MVIIKETRVTAASAAPTLEFDAPHLLSSKEGGGAGGPSSVDTSTTFLLLLFIFPFRIIGLGAGHPGCQGAFSGLFKLAALKDLKSTSLTAVDASAKLNTFIPRCFLSRRKDACKNERCAKMTCCRVGGGGGGGGNPSIALLTFPQGRKTPGDTESLEPRNKWR